MKKLALSTLCVFLIWILAITAIPVSAAKVKINATKKSIYVGDTFKLKLKNATASKVKWSSSDKQLATVSTKGKVTGKKGGTATITATYKGKSYTCVVKIKPIKDIKGTVLYDKNNIRITVENLDTVNEWGYTYYALKLLIENNTQKDITFFSQFATVNDFSFRTNSSIELISGTKGYMNVGILKDEADYCGIKHIMTFDFDIQAFDSNYKTVLMEEFSLKTPDYGKYKQKIDKTGTTLYDKNGIKVVLQNVNKNDKEHPCDIYIVNDTDQWIILSPEECYANGFYVQDFVTMPTAGWRSQAVCKLSFSKNPYNTSSSIFDMDKLKSLTIKVRITRYDKDGSFTTDDMIFPDAWKIFG